MDFDSAIKSVGTQVRVVVDTPIPFVVVLSIAGLAIWQICRWYYEGRLSALEGRIAFRDDEIVTLKERLASLEVNGETKTKQVHASVKKELLEDDYDRARIKAITSMQTALQEAEIELSLARGTFTNRNVPALRAAILTASKMFGIVEPFPAPENHGGPLTLGTGIFLLREVLPLLKEGHLNEACLRSQEIYDAEAERMAKSRATAPD